MMYDRVRLDFTSDVPASVRESILAAVSNVVDECNCYAYEHYDKEAGAWSVDITAHDRTRIVDLTDGQIVARLRMIADERGVSVRDMLREAARESLG